MYFPHPLSPSLAINPSPRKNNKPRHDEELEMREFVYINNIYQ
jgi:hypothetical protein